MPVPSNKAPQVYKKHFIQQYSRKFVCERNTAQNLKNTDQVDFQSFISIQSNPNFTMI